MLRFRYRLNQYFGLNHGLSFKIGRQINVFVVSDPWVPGVILWLSISVQIESFHTTRCLASYISFWVGETRGIFFTLYKWDIRTGCTGKTNVSLGGIIV